jgi:predicted transcriptional regulator
MPEQYCSWRNKSFLGHSEFTCEPSYIVGEYMKRSKDAIISQILDVCTEGASKTRIVYQSNLNFRTVIPYIDLLIKNELLEIMTTRNSSVIFTTTPKGAKLLKDFKNIQSVIPEIYNLAEKEKA